MVGLAASAGYGVLDALIFAFAFTATVKSIKQIVPTLAATAVAVTAIVILAPTVTPGHLPLQISAAVAVLIIGTVAGWCYKIVTLRAPKSKERRKWKIILTSLTEGLEDWRSRAAKDWRIIVIVTSILIAVIITFFFGQFAVAEQPRGFWHGFYEAWTASLVFFGILGVAGTIVSLSRPEMEGFEARVRILCRGRDDPTVDYIREKIRQIGYYSQTIRRTYRVIGYDALRSAYEIEVRHTATNRNFYDDAATDRARLTIHPDPLEPPLEVVGMLLDVKVDGKKVHDPAEIREKLEIEWDIDIPKGREVEVEVVHRAWYRIDKEHVFRPSRFASIVEAEVIYSLKPPAPYLNAKTYVRANPKDMSESVIPQTVSTGRQLVPGEPFQLPPARNCLPGQQAVLLKFEGQPVSNEAMVALEAVTTSAHQGRVPIGDGARP